MPDHHRFGHREHLELGFEALHRYEFDAALQHVLDFLHRHADRLGHQAKINRTISACWLLHLDGAIRRRPRAGLDEILASHPELSDPALPLRYYSRDLLFSQAARTGVVEPDLQPIPGEQAAQTRTTPHPGR
jgi:hypothetical protein